MLRRFMVLLIAVPIVEMFLLLQVGHWIGPPAAIAIVLSSALLGAWLTKHQGVKVIRRFQTALDQGRLPAAEVLEGVLVLAAGILLLTPGFLTDIAGYLLLIPPVRDWAARRLRHYLLSRVHGAPVDDLRASPVPGKPERLKQGPVVDAEIIDD
jgi:UPF0716 protein FxsA